MPCSIEEVRDYLSKAILSGTSGKGEIISLCNWILEWNKILSERNKIVCFRRDYEKNIKFTYNYNNNPSFLVIKLPGTDIVDFPGDLLLDFYLKYIDLFKDIQIFLRKRSHPSHKNRY